MNGRQLRSNPTIVIEVESWQKDCSLITNESCLGGIDGRIFCNHDINCDLSGKVISKFYLAIAMEMGCR